MKQKHDNYRPVPYSKMRCATAVTMRSFQRKPMIHSLLEVDGFMLLMVLAGFAYDIQRQTNLHIRRRYLSWVVLLLFSPAWHC